LGGFLSNALEKLNELLAILAFNPRLVLPALLHRMYQKSRPGPLEASWK
jgi:hypothetical protein